MHVQTYIHSIRRAADYIRSRSRVKPTVGIVLGSGLGQAIPKMKKVVVIPYSKIPGFPRTTVKGHEGKMLLGETPYGGIAVMQGRFHYYEGHSMESIAMPVRVFEYLGMKTLILTTAVGSLRKDYKPGDIVMITDHMNFMGRNPLRAFHEEEFGEMFPDLRNAYDPGLRKLTKQLCKKRGIPVHEGVYTAVGGPSYETPAEIRAFRHLGGDVVGMSLVPEAIVARQMGVRLLAISWISNFASGLTNDNLSHQEVLDLGSRFSKRLGVLFDDLLQRL
ncbi:MAG: purine-nucleoside phosphorylase [Elusimicrobia bacterium]|nr:purine-nucleoside phosphorylase [Elusimicrobiota bacterium]